jgi:hypothetical protein
MRAMTPRSRFRRGSGSEHALIPGMTRPPPSGTTWYHTIDRWLADRVAS